MKNYAHQQSANRFEAPSQDRSVDKSVQSVHALFGFSDTSLGKGIRPFISLLGLATIIVVSAVGCNRLGNSGDDAANAAATVKPSGEKRAADAKAQQEPTEAPSPVKDALTLLLAKEAENKESPFPKGTHLLSVSIKEKLALVDLSSEFNALKNRGESWEGLAQKKLCKTLAPFENLERLRVTVDGKDYESQAADWSNIPIRVPSDEASASHEQEKEKGTLTTGGVERDGGVVVGGETNR